MEISKLINWFHNKFKQYMKAHKLTNDTCKLSFYEGVEFGKGVDLSHSNIDSKLIFKKCIFYEIADFSNCEINGVLEFRECSFHCDLCLHEIKTNGSLLVSTCEFNFTTSNGKSLNLNHSIVNGSLEISNLKIKTLTSIKVLELTVSLRFAKISNFISIETSDPELIMERIDAAGVSAHNDFKIDCPYGLVLKDIDLSNSDIGGNFFMGEFKRTKQNDREQVGTQALILGDKLLMNGACIKGDAVLMSFKARQIDMTNLKIGGDLELIGRSGVGTPLLTINRQLIARCLQVNGSITFYKINVGNKSFAQEKINAIDLSNSRITGNINFNMYPYKPDRDYRPDEPDRSTFTVSGNLDCNSIQVDGNVYISAAEIEGNLCFDSSTLNCSLLILSNKYRATRIEGDLLATAIKGQPWVQCRSVRVKGKLMMLHSETGPFSFSIGLVRSGSLMQPDIIPCSFGQIIIIGCSINGWLKLPYIQVNGTKHDYDFPGVFIKNTYVNGEITFWKHIEFKELLNKYKKLFNRSARNHFAPWEYYSVISGPVRILESHIKGKVDLSFLKTSGPIDIEDSTIEGDLTFRSLITLQEDLHRDKLKNKLCKTIKDNNNCFSFRTITAGAKFRMVTVNNDVDLTGLTVYQDKNNNWCTDYTGMIKARHMNIKGECTTYTRMDDKKSSPVSHLEVPLELDLRDASATVLTVSGYSFPLYQNQPKKYSLKLKEDRGLRLSGGEFGKISIPTFCAENDAIGANPIPIEIVNTSVIDWDLNQGKEPGNQAKAFCKLLVNANREEYRRSVYQNIENILRQQGDTDGADKVFIAMKQKEQKEVVKNFHFHLKNGGNSDLVVLLLVTFTVIAPFLLLDNLLYQIIVVVLVLVITATYLKCKSWFFNTPKKFIEFLWYSLKFYTSYFFVRLGTNALPLFGLFLLLGIFSYPVYRHPANIEASLSRLGVDSQNDTDELYKETFGDSPENTEWGRLNAIAMALRYHVPIIATEFREDWSIRDDTKKPFIYDMRLLLGNKPECFLENPEKVNVYNPTTIAKNSKPIVKNQVCESRIYPPRLVIRYFTAEDWAEFMAILNFIILPVLLTYLLRKILRNW